MKKPLPLINSLFSPVFIFVFMKNAEPENSIFLTLRKNFFIFVTIAFPALPYIMDSESVFILFERGWSEVATIQDIADRLGVSKGTVSKALNGAPDVSETLQKTILETAVEMGYTIRKRRKRKSSAFSRKIWNMRSRISSDMISFWASVRWLSPRDMRWRSSTSRKSFRKLFL